MNISLSLQKRQEIEITIKINHDILANEVSGLISSVAKHALAAGALNLIIGTSIGIPVAALSGASFYLGKRCSDLMLKSSITRLKIREPAIRLCESIINNSAEDFLLQLNSTDFLPSISTAERTFSKKLLNAIKNDILLSSEEELLDTLNQTRPEFKELISSFLNSNLCVEAVNRNRSWNNASNAPEEIDSLKIKDLLYFNLIQSPHSFLDNMIVLSTKILSIYTSLQFFGLSTGLTPVSLAKSYILEALASQGEHAVKSLYSYVNKAMRLQPAFFYFSSAAYSLDNAVRSLLGES